jgi:hypothetical protein
MSRPSAVARLLVALLALAAVTAGVAQAKKAAPVKVVGESTTFTLSPAVLQKLDALQVKLSVVAPATRTGAGTATFPVTNFRGNARKLRGVVRHAGGLRLTRGERSVTLRDVVVVSNGRRGYATAKLGQRRIRVFRLTNPTRDVQGAKVTLSVKLRLTAQGARFVNRRLASAHLKAGRVLGTAVLSGALVPGDEQYADPLA